MCRTKMKMQNALDIQVVYIIDEGTPVCVTCRVTTRHRINLFSLTAVLT